MKLDEIRKRLSVGREFKDRGNKADVCTVSNASITLVKPNKCCNPWCAESATESEKICELCKVYPLRWPEPQSRLPFRKCIVAGCSKTAGFRDPATGNLHCKEHSVQGYTRVGYEKCIIEGCDNEVGILDPNMEELRKKGYCLDHQYICSELGCKNRTAIVGGMCPECEVRVRLESAKQS